MRPPALRVFWREQRPERERRLPPVAQDLSAEVAVVGGGVAGLHCAQTLREQGRSVVLLERETCGGGASGRSSGFITPDSEMELSRLVRDRGAEEARRLWEFAAGGVEAIRANVERHGLDCDLQVQDSLFLASSKRGAARIRDEHRARQNLGYGSTFYDAAALPAVLGARGCCSAVRYPGTFGINAFRYCQELRDRLVRSGVIVHENSPVTAVGEGRVLANGCTVRAEVVVLCLDRFLPELGLLPREVYHAQTFLAVSAPLDAAQIARIFPERRLMVWDSDLIYQYFRLTGGGRLLLGASSALLTYARRERPAAPRVLRKMRAWLGRTFPGVPVELEYFWPGLIGLSKDFIPLALLDPARPALGLVSGATGLPWAAALGRYMAEKIQSGRSDFDAAFDPRRRFPVGPAVQSLLGKPGAFALSHGIVKILR